MVLSFGTYEYCLVVDGKWMPNLLAKERVADPFGGVNSVLKVGQGANAGLRGTMLPREVPAAT